MKDCVSLRAMSRIGRALVGLAVTLILVSCGLGEAVVPDPPPGEPADRSAGVVIAVPAPIPHSLAGREECYTCHAIGAVDAPPVPVGHEQDVGLCTTCHAEWLAPAIAAAAPPAISHELEGRGDCLVCHKLGTADAPRVPDNHDGLTSDICQTCHTAVDEISEGEVGGPVAEIPSIPHGLEGFSACTSCHAEGGSGIPRMPDDHEGRTDDLCSACHEPMAEGEEVTPSQAPETPTAEAVETPALVTGDAVNGEILYGPKCAVCHGAAGEGAAIAPEPINDEDLLAELSGEDLTTIILEGIEGKMPGQSDLDEQEVIDLVAFLLSWQ